MKKIITHADSVYQMRSFGNKGLYENEELHMDLKSSLEADTLLACQSLFLMKGEREYIYDIFQEHYDFYMDVFNENEEYAAIIKSYSDIEDIYKTNKVPVMVTVEDMGYLNGDLSQVEKLYDMGIRMATLTWNYENSFAYPCSSNAIENSRGLKEKGKDAVEILNSVGIIVDVSHLSDGGIDEVLSISKRPIIASHSNARIITNHPRNCTDDQIRRISEKGGFLGINFYREFLSYDHRASIENMVRHIRHMIKVGGSESVALGTDFDGIDNLNLEIKNVKELDNLYWALHKEGYSDSEIENIFYRNALKTFKEILR